ncbi:MAG: dihydrofolate reductase family protein [Candidatus Paceibacterota bacterium]
MATLKQKVKYTAFVAASIDGRIAKSNNSGTDWTSKEDWRYFQKALSKVDAVIAGYNTYQQASPRLKKRNTFVLTSRVKSVKKEGIVTFINPKKFNLKKFLETSNYKNVAIVGGSKAYNFCLENKMLDELLVTIEPYVFTNGVPMFTGEKFKKYKLSLESIKKLNQKGTILLSYKYEN